MPRSAVGIPVSSPALIGNERRYVLDCLDRAELSWHGAYVGLFEQAFANFCGTTYAVATCNGTAALHLALIAAGVKRGDVVYLPALTYIATANAVMYVGAEPVFCDVEPETWNLDPADVERRIQPGRRGAILAVHLYGLPANMTELGALARRKGLKLIEDAAEAHGATEAGGRTGSLGQTAAFSFFANKVLTTGEGGMVTTNNPDMANLARHYRGQGMTDRRFFHDVVAFNYRMTNIQAAIGLGQLEQFEAHSRARALICGRYRDELAGFEMQQEPIGSTNGNWLFSLLVPKGVDRDGVMAHLADANIETRPTFVPLTEMPPYLGRTPAVTTDIGRRGISLPTFAGLSDVDQSRVIGTFRAVTS